ncbi:MULTISPECIES: peptidoglycan-binding protein [Streptomyces]|uniref:peptidoglycan-binding protein n=1 Tax=Streptomyces TaxID=1883 RepID=UPI001FDB9463|nr:peptidoglycan-binding protein [Streptomyces sp. CL12-4]MCG8968919.1 peptidoglycan-binding protein [Streptomyces sp. CL12-4]
MILPRTFSRAVVTATLTGAMLAPAASVTSFAAAAPASHMASTGATAARSVTAATWPALRQGARGVDVATAQDLLAAAGHPVSADGVFGTATTRAVKDFQKSRQLAADGVVGARTWTALTVTVRPGSKGRAVRALQRQLGQEGHRLAVDGLFGAGTGSAVRAVQRAHGLSVDGVAGPRTWAALLAAPGRPSGDVSALRKRIVATARGQIGVFEPSGCRTYLKDCARTAWCAAFVSWTWRKAGVPSAAVPKTLVAREVGLWGQRNGLFHRTHPKPGDIVVWGEPAAKTGGHVGIVVAVHADGRIDTVDGNYRNKVTFRKNIDPRTATTRSHSISGYVSPRGA